MMQQTAKRVKTNKSSPPLMDANTYAALKVVILVDEVQQHKSEVDELKRQLAYQADIINAMRKGMDDITSGLRPDEQQLVSGIKTECEVSDSGMFLVRPFDMQIAGILAPHVDMTLIRIDKIITAMRVHGFWWCELDYDRPPRLHTIAIVTNNLDCSVYLENFARAHNYNIHTPIVYNR